jgi:hypothetical protein
MRSPASAFEERGYGAKKFWLRQHSNFFNRIGQQRTHALQQKERPPRGGPPNTELGCAGYALVVCAAFSHVVRAELIPPPPDSGDLISHYFSSLYIK